MQVRRRWRTPKKRWRRALIGLVLLLFLLSIVTFWTIDRRLRPTLMQISEARARQVATDVINKAINEKVAFSIRYEQLISVRPDSQGKIAMIQYNTGEISRLSSITAVYVQSALKKIDSIRIRIPLGQVLGSQILAAWGPAIYVKVMPIGTVSSKVVDRFEQAGINQTRHKIYLVVEADMRIVIPLVSSAVKVESQVPLTEATIMGEVPHLYLNAGPESLMPSLNGNNK
jgi:sporulation protein YunB